jgi:steroid delta-isomerase-like uncharacterized protein
MRAIVAGTRTPADRGVSAATNAALVNRLYDLWNERDLDGALGMATDNVEIRLMASGQTLAGLDGFRRFMERFALASSDMKKEVTNQIASDDHVVSEFRLRGTHDGPLGTPTGEIHPTGRAVDLRVIEVIGIHDGKVATIRNYSDTATLTRQLGLSE